MQKLFNNALKYFLLLAPLAVMSACNNDDPDDNEKGDTADRVINRWLYQNIMPANYLWPEDIPSSSEMNYDWAYNVFFKKMLSDNDGKHYADESGYYYSYIEKNLKRTVSGGTRADDYKTTSYGFDYIFTQLFVHDPRVAADHRDQQLFLTVAYVAEGSPAEQAGLKRGDHIFKIAGQEITYKNYGELILLLRPVLETESTTVTLCTFEENTTLGPVQGTVDGNPVSVPVVTREEGKLVTLKADIITESPVYYADILNAGSRQVGYLVYNQFERGGPDQLFDAELITAFSDLAGINDLVLDLRYNPGGYVTSMQLLASLIVPQTYAGRVLQRQVYSSGNYTDVTYTRQANTVGLEKIYIIATSYSASASEALLHCLRGSGLEVIHIGNTTEGKNVGMTDYSSDALSGGQADLIAGWEYIAWPVTFWIRDSQGNSYPSSGINPGESNGYIVYEDFLMELEDLGNPNEPMLASALYHIRNGTFPPATRAAVRSSVDDITPFRGAKPPVGLKDDLH